ncbi:MAG: malto-oligosyltrehalose synthase [Candidatus Omnitrophica bacterium]|nr:malto-oligosyltrehalose synthase [Candidatus Omnitrophota bacterium]
MKVPASTYRLQLHSAFTFHDTQKIVPYLEELGITDIYASPIFTSTKDSQHGYDVVDPTQINPQLGGREGFEQLSQQVRQRNMGWLQDIVPNHMAFDSKNRLLMDIFEHGPLSKYYGFFDIQWDHPYVHLKGRVLAPFLGDLYGACLNGHEIKLNFDEEGFSIRYSDWKLPILIDGYSKLISFDLTGLEQKLANNSEDYLALLEISNAFHEIKGVSDIHERYSRTALLKARLWKLYNSNEAIKHYMDGLVARINGSPGDPNSLNALDELLQSQCFRLCYWKVGNEELNYRRFFTINGLLSVKVENKEVFEYTHQALWPLVNSGAITGVRIDHIDGLYSPVSYIDRLRERQPELYIAVEKILDSQEHLVPSMRVQGTTGYDFLNAVNGIFIEPKNEKLLDHFYNAFTGLRISYHALVSQKKKFFMGRYMAGDIDNLALLLKEILTKDRYGRDMTMYALRRAIVEIMAFFPVYRSYIRQEKLTQADQIHIKEATVQAKNQNPGLIHEIEMIETILLMDFTTQMEDPGKQEYFHFIKRFQQFSGALMAKGAEDTSFYVYNRFISLNEVGGDPSVLATSTEEFHGFMSKREKLWPLTMNATATHDTKRGEDVRARLNVISELAGEWAHHVRRWNKVNRPYKKYLAALDVRAPSRNDEYFIYQTLMGTYPYGEDVDESYPLRVKEYWLKALREAQIYTSWTRPNVEYEEACLSFLANILALGSKFLESFLPLLRKVAQKGFYNSLAQTLLKMTCPGIPDFYQGCELWDFSLVDPDNRRSVDYEYRMQLLKGLQNANGAEVSQIIDHKQHGRVKMFMIEKILKARKKNPDLFLRGEYIPLNCETPVLDKQIIAFARKRKQTWLITTVCRFSTQLADNPEPWNDAYLVLPSDAPKQWSNVLNGKKIVSSEKGLSIIDMFDGFPVVCLIAEN